MKKRNFPNCNLGHPPTHHTKLIIFINMLLLKDVLFHISSSALLLGQWRCLLLSLFWRGLELVPKRQMRHREAHHVTEGLAAPLLLSFLSALGLELLVLDTTREDD